MRVALQDDRSSLKFILSFRSLTPPLVRIPFSSKIKIIFYVVYKQASIMPLTQNINVLMLVATKHGTAIHSIELDISSSVYKMNEIPSLSSSLNTRLPSWCSLLLFLVFFYPAYTHTHTLLYYANVNEWMSCAKKERFAYFMRQRILLQNILRTKAKKSSDFSNKYTQTHIYRLTWNGSHSLHIYTERRKNWCSYDDVRLSPLFASSFSIHGIWRYYKILYENSFQIVNFR